MGFDATEKRSRRDSHTFNLISQMLLWGKDKEPYYIKTPQQYALFEKYQRLAHGELPANALAEKRKVKEPVKPVVTRWNSYFLCFKRAVEVQLAATEPRANPGSAKVYIIQVNRNGGFTPNAQPLCLALPPVHSFSVCHHRPRRVG
jgi:hypothetical protein